MADPHLHLAVVDQRQCDAERDYGRSEKSISSRPNSTLEKIIGEDLRRGEIAQQMPNRPAYAARKKSAIGCCRRTQRRSIKRLECSNVARLILSKGS
jgi:hypothetical protein